MKAILNTLICWLLLPWNIRQIRKDAAVLDKMVKENPGQIVYYLPPKR